MLGRGPAAILPRLAALFKRLFPDIEIESATPIVTNGNVITCGPDFATPGLIQRMFAWAVGLDVAHMLEMRDPQIAPTPLFDITSDRIVAEAKIWIRERFARDFGIAELARGLGVSHQTLIRRFKAAGAGTPRAYAQNARVSTAASMLIETDRTIAEIAALVGYSDTASFRKIFTERSGMTPSQFRKTPATGNRNSLEPIVRLKTNPG